MKKTSLMMAAAGAVGVFAGAASADAILSWGFTDLEASYTAGNFEARAVDTANLQTGGDVSRLSPGSGTAEFESGFMGLGTSADVRLDLDVTNNTGSTADGSGTFSILDANGVELRGAIDGQWIRGSGGFTFFNGHLTNIGFSDPNTMFEGPSGGTFGTDLPGTPPFEGALVQVFVSQASSFFANDFSGVSSQASAVVIPAPAGAAVLFAGGLLALRRRRAA